MSYIFDALQKSEAERSGIDRKALAAATDVLQVAERQARAGCRKSRAGRDCCGWGRCLHRRCFSAIQYFAVPDYSRASDKAFG